MGYIIFIAYIVIRPCDCGYMPWLDTQIVIKLLSHFDIKIPQIHINITSAYVVCMYKQLLIYLSKLMNFNRITNSYFRRSCVHIEIHQEKTDLLFYYLNIKNTLQLTNISVYLTPIQKQLQRRDFWCAMTLITYSRLQIEL